MRTLVIVIVAVVLLGGIAGGAYWYTHRNANGVVKFRTAPVARGDLVSTITATGTVEPEEVVDVGAQVAGVILDFGKDANGKPIDYNSVVNKDMVLARIDPSLYQADLASAQAAQESADANVVRAKADLIQKQALLVQATNDWNRAQKLGTETGALAQTSYDQYQANFESAKANVTIDEANIKVAQAASDQAKAALDRAKENLAYCTITSPVEGTIIDRRVNSGQTVVSSLSTPSLFLIAKDLKAMQVWVAVNEADVGNIFDGQPVKFTVDAFPNHVFDGTVGRRRLNATMTQNVVTYTVEVNTDNSSGRLLPYLTANAYFETGRRDKVLMVPNAALRWTPTPAQMGPNAPAASAGKSKGKRASEGDQAAAKTEAESSGTQAETTTSGGGQAIKPPAPRRTHAKVWAAEGAYVRAIPVTVGLTDGINTEVSGEGLQEGLQVITGDASPGAAQAQVANTGASPFTPQMPARTRSGR